MNSDIWIPVKDGDSRALALYQRHYSYRPYADGRNPKLFVGPGKKIVLLSPQCDALFVWRHFHNDDGNVGTCCSVFRNESSMLSSLMILDAERILLNAWHKIYTHRLYTYVNPQSVKGSNPGFCFLKAGWRKCGMSQKGLVILEKVIVEHPYANSFLPENEPCDFVIPLLLAMRRKEDRS